MRISRCLRNYQTNITNPSSFVLGTFEVSSSFAPSIFKMGAEKVVFIWARLTLLLMPVVFYFRYFLPFSYIPARSNGNVEGDYF